MSMNNKIKKSLILTLGLVIGGLYTSTCDIYAAEREVVRADKLNVRKGPSVEEDKIESLTQGTVIEILERSNGWNKIKISEQEGWVSDDYTSNEKGTVKVNKLNVRKGPSTEEDKVESLNKGTAVEILEVENNWYKVKSEGKEIGWVSGDYILTETQAKEVSTNEESTNSNTNQNTSSENNTGRLMIVNASAYSGHTITSTGTTPKWGTIAVDPTVIPYGTKVYIPKFDKVFIAEDCGGAIKGNKIDIFMNSEAECNTFGRQNIEIQILN